ncbi:hypothetical protein VSP9026_01483 [Vibrio spartinae]|uniref:Phage abortive infection protein n=2 Tax=Vibrio spartinae TaxID=1918945 RepID=A0A1N6M323_9VIBR|nr:hypothetical protein VSP9026_01483 [Vibrio spartinae]
MLGAIIGGAMNVFVDIGAAWLSAIAAIIAAFGAIFAANFTRKTLTFLTKQHEDQQALQRIQMYQSHKEAFMKLLDELEQTYENRYKFTDRDRFYRSIFPENNFNNFSTSVDIKQKGSSGELSDKIACYQILVREILTYTSVDFNKLDNIVTWVMRLKNQLHIVKIKKYKSGDVILDDKMLFSNIFYINREVHHFKYILDNLIIFTGNTFLEKNKPYIFPYSDLLDYCLLYSGPRGLKVYFNNELLVKTLYAVRDHAFRYRDEENATSDHEAIFTKLSDLFKEDTELDEKLGNTNYVYNLIDSCIKYLYNHKLDGHSSLSVQRSKFINNLSDAQKELIAKKDR